MTQIRQLLGQPAYRTKLVFFLILGFAIILLSILLRSISIFWSDLLKEFAVVFVAVGVLQLMWDFLGGDPMELLIREVRDEVTSIKQTMTLLSDLVDGNIGIERIWPDREAWQEDPEDGLRVWRERVCKADKANIMSNTLWSNWMKNAEFRQGVFDSIAGGASTRILIYDPNSEAVRLRAKLEKDVPGEMESEIRSTLLRLAEGWNGLAESARANLEVRLTTWALHPAQVIRADEQMLLGLYLSGGGGTPAPTVQLRGSESSYFRKYAEQFDILWGWGTPLNDDQFRHILQESEGLSSPPTED